MWLKTPDSIDDSCCGQTQSLLGCTEDICAASMATVCSRHVFSKPRRVWLSFLVSLPTQPAPRPHNALHLILPFSQRQRSATFLASRKPISRLYTTFVKTKFLAKGSNTRNKPITLFIQNNRDQYISSEESTALIAARRVFTYCFRISTVSQIPSHTSPHGREYNSYYRCRASHMFQMTSVVLSQRLGILNIQITMVVNPFVLLLLFKNFHFTWQIPFLWNQSGEWFLSRQRIHNWSCVFLSFRRPQLQATARSQYSLLPNMAFLLK